MKSNRIFDLQKEVRALDGLRRQEQEALNAARADNEALKRAIREAKADRDALRRMLLRVVSIPDTMPAADLLALEAEVTELLGKYPYEDSDA